MDSTDENGAQSWSRRWRRRAGLVLLLGSLCAVGWEMRAVLPQADDAYISYRYARNLAAGHGLVFNIGERVEGFTNLLWTLLIAVGIRLGFEARTAAHILATLSEALLLVMTYLHARRRVSPERSWLAGLTPWIVFSSVPYAVWGPSGLETPLFAALVAATLLAAEADRRWLATACAVAATLTRPEGLLVAAVIFGQLLVTRQRPWRDRVLPGLVYAACLLALTGFRLAYYGMPLPNTFYAKVGGIPILYGAWYAQHFFEVGPAILVVPSFFALRDRASWAGGAFVLLLLSYVTAIGGDAFFESRFLLPALPVLAVMCASGVERAWRSNPKLGVLLATSLPSTLLCHLFGTSAAPLVVTITMTAATFLLTSIRLSWAGWTAGALFVPLALLTVLRSFAAPMCGFAQPVKVRARAETARATRDSWRSLEATGRDVAAAFLAQSPPPVRLVAMAGIGSTGYALGDVKVLDLVGLTDPVIARTKKKIHGALVLAGHTRTNAAYVLERRPDIIAAGLNKGLVLAATRELFDTPEFHEAYREMSAKDLRGVFVRRDRDGHSRSTRVRASE